MAGVLRVRNTRLKRRTPLARCGLMSWPNMRLTRFQAKQIFEAFTHFFLFVAVLKLFVCEFKRRRLAMLFQLIFYIFRAFLFTLLIATANLQLATSALFGMWLHALDYVGTSPVYPLWDITNKSMARSICWCFVRWRGLIESKGCEGCKVFRCRVCNAWVSK